MPAPDQAPTSRSVVRVGLPITATLDMPPAVAGLASDSSAGRPVVGFIAPFILRDVRGARIRGFTDRRAPFH